MSPAAADSDVHTTNPASRSPLLVLTTTLPARPGDGTPEFVLTLARALSNSYDITIVAPRIGSAVKSEDVDGMHIVRFGYFPKRWEGLADGAILANLEAQPWRWLEVPLFLVRFLWTAARQARRTRAQVIHAHWIVPGGLVARLVGRRRIPYIVSAHGADVYALNGPGMRSLKRAVLARASSVAVASSDVAHTLHMTDRCITVPMGVDVAAIGAEVDRAPEPGRSLFVGRMVPKKGLDVLLRALALLPDTHLVAIGDGPGLPRSRALAAELGIAERVGFLGHQPRSRVMAELARASVLVIPSIHEPGKDADTSPVVMSEAMAAGVPIIASGFGGLAEHIRSGVTGLLVPQGSVEDLAAALRDALERPDLLEEWARNARAAMVGRLDIATTRARYDELIVRALTS